MTRKGLPGEVTFTLTPKHETERAVGTAKEAVFQAEGIARAETGPRLGFGVWSSGSWAGGASGSQEGGVRPAAVGGAWKPGRGVRVSLTARARGESSGSLKTVSAELLIKSRLSRLDEQMHCGFLDQVLEQKGR